MVTIRTQRQEIETILYRFFPRMNLYKRTRLSNLAHLDLTSEAFLTAVVINCVLEEVELILKKRLINCATKTITVKLSEAQSAILYRSLIALPLENANVYEFSLRNQWVERLDQALILSGFYKRAEIQKPEPPPRSESDYDMEFLLEE